MKMTECFVFNLILWFSNIGQLCTLIFKICFNFNCITLAKLFPTMYLLEEKKLETKSYNDTIISTSIVINRFQRLKLNERVNSIPGKICTDKRKLEDESGKPVRKKLRLKTTRISLDKQNSSSAQLPLEENKKIISFVNTEKTLSFYIRTHPNLEILPDSPLKSAEFICQLFRNCINFVITSRLFPENEVDNVLRCIWEIGPVSEIQDHWSYSDSSLRRKVWKGAMIAFQRTPKLQSVLKKIISNDLKYLLPVFIPLHFYNMAKIECELGQREDASFQRPTTILIRGIETKKVKTKLLRELKCYGKFLVIHFFRSYCVINYKYTVEAYAVALALDGKKISNYKLETCVIMNKKELEIHYKLYSSLSF